MNLISKEKLQLVGMRFGRAGVHTARTMMLDEISQLMHEMPQMASLDSLKLAVVEQNLLGKPSRKARELSWRHLTDLYGFRADVPIFRVFSRLWSQDAAAQPLLALSLALARDSLLKASRTLIVDLKPGEGLAREVVTDWLEKEFPERFSPATKQSVAQNLNGSWTMAGYLTGRQKKLRATPVVRPANVAFNLFLAHLEGATGQRLFASEWLTMLPGSVDEQVQLTVKAANAGLLVFMNAGGVIEARFPNYLTAAEEALLHE